MSAKKPPAKARKRRAKKQVVVSEFIRLADQLAFRGPCQSPNRQTSWWSLPAKGEYLGGNEVGAAAAWAFMKFLREIRNHDGGGTLQHIALDMLGGKRADNPSVRGQAVGFFSVLDHYLRRAAALDTGLDYCTFEGFRKQIEKGLAHTTADDAALLRGYREAAKLERQTKA